MGKTNLLGQKLNIKLLKTQKDNYILTTQSLNALIATRKAIS